MSQVPMAFEPHCGNCDPLRAETNLRILEACDDAHVSKYIEMGSYPMDLSGLSPEVVDMELFHQRTRTGLFLEVQRRRSAGEKRKPDITPGRSHRVPCVQGCGTLVHIGGTGLCRPCSLEGR
jgi:hypothetical protein